jgi:hypothetical protein
MPITIKTNLYGNGSIRVWAQSVEKALQAVNDGLVATQRKEVWGLDWPRQNVTKLGAFREQKKEFKIVAELVNSQNKVIGKEEFKVNGKWNYDTWECCYKSVRPKVNVESNGREDVRFRDVNVNNITDNLTIRFATVNGEDAATAAKKGVLQIKAISKSEFDANEQFTFEFGVIERYNWEKEEDLNIDIPNTIWDDPVILIKEEAFERVYKNGKLIGVTIPNSVTYIGNRAFSDNKLTSVTIPNSVTHIGEYAFSSNKLTSVTIPNSVTYIGIGAFVGNKLTGVTIPNSVTSIGEYVFSKNELISVTIPNSVTSIGKDAFSYNKLTTVTILDGVTSIGNSAFSSSNELINVTIPNSVTSIGESAFSGNKMTSVTIPNSVTSIGKDAFYINELTDITIGGNVKIDETAFGGCYGCGHYYNLFEDVYKDNGNRAGKYSRTPKDKNNTFGNWHYVGSSSGTVRSR